MPPVNKPYRSAGRITYAQLRERISAGDLELGEVIRYFEVDQRAADNLRFSVKLNKKHVNLDGQRPSAEEINALMDEVTEKELLKSSEISVPGLEPFSGAKHSPEAKSGAKAKSMAKPTPVRPLILNEGDSWFRLPFGLKPNDCMVTLRKRYSIEPLAHWGDTLAEMVAAKSYIQKLTSGTKYDLFMFSGGGNDVLGAISQYVGNCDSGDTNPDNAAKYIKPEFSTALSGVMKLYNKMVDQVRAVSPAKIMVHGYANAIPVQNGKYIGRYLQAKGFQTGVGDMLSRKIVELMVGQFNTGLKKLAKDRPGVIYVDLRKSVVQGFWNNDEIHPNDDGALRVADRFTAAIEELWPSV